MECRIRVVRTFAEFLALAGRWNALLHATASDTVFLTWEWLYTWSKHFLDEKQLWIVLAFKNDELIGIAPLCVRSRPAGMISVREMRFLGSEDVGSTQLDFIVRRKHKASVLRAIYRHLHEEASAVWDLLTLSELPAESSSIDLWELMVGEAGRVMDVNAMTPAPFIDLRDGLEHFLKSLSGNERSNLRRKQRHLEGLGRVTYERMAPGQDVDRALNLLVELHQMRWTQKGAAGVFADDRQRLFHREIARTFSEKGWLRIDFLRLGDDAIAGVYGFAYGDRYFFFLPGLNPQIAAKSSPGILLLFRCVEEAVGEQCKEFSLLRGAVDYKMAWASGVRRCVTLRCYNRHLRSAVVKAVEGGKATIKMLVR